MSIAVALKTCPKCDEEKPLSEFHRNRSRSDGRHTWCKVCVRRATKDSAARRRKEMGEEAWLLHQRTLVKNSRAAGNSHDKEQRAAWHEAQRRLREAHRSEFDQYYREERYKRGLDV